MREVAKPVAGPRDILIKVRATTVTSGDWRVRSLDVPTGFGLVSRLMFGISKPRQPILGTEAAGVVEAVGAEVTRFEPGDEVIAFSDASMGCHAEYKVMGEDGLVVSKPASLSFEEAAGLSFGGATALQFFRRGKLEGGEKLLVNGASGGVGTAAVQLASHFGADVTGVCSAANLELVRSLGAHRVIDYTSHEVLGDGETYDVIMDTAGTISLSRARVALRDGGRLLVVLGSLLDMVRAPWVSMTSSIRVVAGPASATVEDLRVLADLAEAGHFRPVIDRIYPFEQMVDAHRHVDQGHKRGNVVVALGEG